MADKLFTKFAIVILWSLIMLFLGITISTMVYTNKIQNLEESYGLTEEVMSSTVYEVAAYTLNKDNSRTYLLWDDNNDKLIEVSSRLLLDIGDECIVLDDKLYLIK